MPPTKGKKTKKTENGDEAANLPESGRSTRSTRQRNQSAPQPQEIIEDKQEQTDKSKSANETNEKPIGKKRALKSKTVVDVDVEEDPIDNIQEPEEPIDILPTKRGRKVGTEKSRNEAESSAIQKKGGRKHKQEEPKENSEHGDTAEPKPSKKRGRKAAATSDNEDTGDETWQKASTFYEFKVNTIDNKEVSLEKYKGHPCIIVNVASRCGYTKANYEAFVELFDKYSDENGLRILAFPCNQFGGQEPGDAAKICEFTKKKNVKFDLFEKINVNGDDAHPLWKYLKEQKAGPKGKDITWNFTKFLINKEGKVAERLQPGVKKPKILEELEKLW